MAQITVVNNTGSDINVFVAKDNETDDGSFITVSANGGTESWDRNNWQAVFIARDQAAGSPLEVVLGVPNQTVYIN
ncbi:hypothetical protein VMT65_23015 [Nocardia sp. CDC153]|uniref:hypothetical protein n=1 Tax=Nocardia sp. CDC153 TaxID=3112167 RepID=UPI002DBC66D9|nr:hypothetical protein [Nocardia sp. CDC153]MEC3955924.1 hypothetical protein [Nocardia sp. CDC153]